MTTRRLRALVVAFLFVPAPVLAQAPVSYRLSFPAPEHRWMQVEVTFADLPAGTLQIRASRSCRPKRPDRGSPTRSAGSARHGWVLGSRGLTPVSLSDRVLNSIEW